MWYPREELKNDLQDVNNELNELYELKGRVKALEAYISNETYSINKGVVLAMLGFDTPPEIPNAEAPPDEPSEVDE